MKTALPVDAFSHTCWMLDGRASITIAYIFILGTALRTHCYEPYQPICLYLTVTTINPPASPIFTALPNLCYWRTGGLLC
uniref:Uncharacterized protein n=1 Tax=Picea sitchensis TaxID=3332 RepID=A0A6B9XRJ8_PICSI|nr:hypothetical protein Q903MT_gene4282 [Picea sitchensis]